MEGSKPALPAEPGTLKATLADTPNIAQMTERESAHPSYQHFEQVTLTNGMATVSINAPDTPDMSQEGSCDVVPGQKNEVRLMLFSLIWYVPNDYLFENQKVCRFCLCQWALPFISSLCS